MKKLDLDQGLVAEARELAARIARPVEEMIDAHTTIAIERAVLRLLGLDGAVGEGVDARPSPNLVVEAVRDQVGLGRGLDGLRWVIGPPEPGLAGDHPLGDVVDRRALPEHQVDHGDG
ncbi:MAG TPA: lysine 5,6-aminomutase subunit alpha, partial [Actinomycetota bacterium]|nr:lysine 5,6-aminomutase subunit alpha [Actinomycetota bacterium]